MNKLSVGWGPISACNMNCQFCYSRHKRTNSKDLHYDDWVKFIDENNREIEAINYGTGENSLSLDWFKLVKYIRHNYPDIRQAVTTNGNLGNVIKNDDWCLQVFKEGIDEVDVSLDFADAKQHNSFRGWKYAYESVIDTLSITKLYNKPTTIVFLGSEKNVYIENIEGLFAIAEKYNAILRMNIFRPTYGINELSKQFMISRESLLDLLEYISNNHQILAINDSYFSSLLTGKTIDDPNASQSIRILADGSITPSTYLIEENYIVANITDSNVLSNNKLRNKLSGMTSKIVPQDCIGCKYENTCSGGVFDRRYLWYGTLQHKDPYCKERIYSETLNTINISNESFVSVHDGYLPTMFFKP